MSSWRCRLKHPGLFLCFGPINSAKLSHLPMVPAAIPSLRYPSVRLSRGADRTC